MIFFKVELSNLALHPHNLCNVMTHGDTIIISSTECSLILVQILLKLLPKFWPMIKAAIISRSSLTSGTVISQNFWPIVKKNNYSAHYKLEVTYLCNTSIATSQILTNSDCSDFICSRHCSVRWWHSRLSIGRCSPYH